MSISEETTTSSEIVPPLSFQAKLAQRRKELESDTIFEIPVPGYDDLWARYRVLGFEDIRDIGKRVERETNDETTAERLNAAETLAVACVELLEYKGLDADKKPVFAATGYRWSWQAARDLFEADIAEGTTAKEAVCRIFPYPRDMLMMNHFQKYMELGMEYMPEIMEALMGESQVPSEGTS